RVRDDAPARGRAIRGRAPAVSPRTTVGRRSGPSISASARLGPPHSDSRFDTSRADRAGGPTHSPQARAGFVGPVGAAGQRLSLCYERSGDPSRRAASTARGFAGPGGRAQCLGGAGHTLPARGASPLPVPPPVHTDPARPPHLACVRQEGSHVVAARRTAAAVDWRTALGKDAA